MLEIKKTKMILKVKGVRKMKKILALLSLTLLVVTSLATFRDIPKGHWAKSYVDRLAEIGIVTGFPDGTYRGDEAVTRYQSALLVSRTIDYIELLLKEKQELIDKLTALSMSNSESLGEVRKKLNEAQSELEDLQKELEDVKLQLELHDNDVVKLYELVTQLQDKFVYTDSEGNISEVDLSELKNDVAGLSDILNNLAAQLGDIDYLLRKQISDLDKKTATADAELSKAIEELNATIELLKSKYDDLSETVASIYDMLSQAILGLQEDFAAFKAVLADKFSEIEARLDELEVRVLNIESNLGTALPALRDLIYGLSENLSQLESSMKAYADILYEELNAKISTLDEQQAANARRIEDISISLETLNDILFHALLGQQEEIVIIRNQLDKLNNFVVNFSNETTEKLEVLDMRTGLLEEQVASLSQVVNETKADKSDVENLEKELKKIDSASKAEIEQAKNMATFGIVSGIIGVVIGIFALGTAMKWW